MNSRSDLLDCEDRDDNGYPRQRCPTTRPLAKINSGGAPLNGPNVDQSVGKRINDAVPWVALACLLAGLSLGVSVMQGAVADAKLDRSKAELRAEFAQEIADARAEAKAAGTDAAIWKNRVVGLEKTLEAQRNVRR